MRLRCMLPALLIAAMAPAAQAQTDDSGIPSETQKRLQSGIDREAPWDLLGLSGLIGLLGLRRRHPEDGYHPIPVE